MLGALTLKPQAYGGRAWEIFLAEAENFFQGIGKLRLSIRGSKLFKINAIEWLCDRVRFGFDGLRRQRLVGPLAKGNYKGWSNTMSSWYNLAWGFTAKFSADGFSKWGGWATRVYRLTQGWALNLLVVMERTVPAKVYHGAFGLIKRGWYKLSLPVSNPYEESGTLLGPTGSITYREWGSLRIQSRCDQTFAFVGEDYLMGFTQGFVHPRLTESVLRVSPVQSILLE